MVPNRYYRVSADPTVGQAFEEHANEYVRWSPSSGYVFCTPTDGDKLSEEGSCTIECWDGDEWTEVSGSSSALTLSGQNVGGAAGQFFINWVGGQLNLRTLEGTGVAQVTTNGSVVRVHVPAPPAATGEVNSGANVGAGAGVWKDKSGLNLRFRSLVSGNGSIQITQNADTIDLAANVSAGPTYSMTSLGVTEPEVYGGISGTQFQLRRIRAVTEAGVPFDVVQNGSYIDVEWEPSTGSVTMFGDTLHLDDLAPAAGQVPYWHATDGWVRTTLSSLGTGQGTVYKSGTPFQFRSLRQGTGVTITQDANEITINASGGTYTGSNLGTAGAGNDGFAVFSSLTSNDFRFRRVKPGTGMTLTENANHVLFDWSATGANVGTGAGLWKDKHTDSNLRFRSIIGGNGLTATQNADDVTIDVDSWSNLVRNDPSATGEDILSSASAPWTLRGLLAGPGIGINVTANDLEIEHDLTASNVGTGVGVMDGIVGADIQGRSVLAGPGIAVTLVGDDIVVENTSGGSSGAGASGTALVGGYHNAGTTTAMDRWAASRTTVKFPSTNLSVATVTKNVANEEFTFNKAMKVKVSAKATMAPGAGHHELYIIAQHFTGGNWVDVAASEGYAYSPNTGNDRQTAHTGEFALNVAVGEKLRIQVTTTIGGTLTPSLGPYATGITIEEAVGPIWEIVTLAGTSLTLNSGHDGKVINCTSGSTVTITVDEDLLVSFQCDVIQSGAGTVQIRESGAAAINSTVGDTPDLSAQYGRARIVAVAGTGANDAVFNVSGDIV